MPSREELKGLIDLLPEDKLAHVEKMLEYQLIPPKPRPEFDAMMRRSEEYRLKVLQRFQETKRPGTCGGGIGSGSGSFGEHDGMSYGRQGMQYWDGKALVHQSMQFFEGREIEIMEQISISENQSLCLEIELSSGGKVVRYSDEFPLMAT